MRGWIGWRGQGMRRLRCVQRHERHERWRLGNRRRRLTEVITRLIVHVRLLLLHVMSRDGRLHQRLWRRCGNRILLLLYFLLDNVIHLHLQAVYLVVGVVHKLLVLFFVVVQLGGRFLLDRLGYLLVLLIHQILV